MINATKFLVLLLLLAVATVFAMAQYPSHTMKHGELEVMLFLPDKQESYYQASRFDWGSIVGQISYENHTYLQQWKDYNGRGPIAPHNPLTPNTATGLAEEFIIPLGYDETDTNDCFVKIGVGVLQKVDDKPYNFATAYKIIDTGKRFVRRSAKSTTITHQLNSDIGYGYCLKRTYLLRNNKLIVSHLLKNIGDKHITTETYSHNFMQFDFGAFAPDISLEFLNSEINTKNHKWITGNRVKIGKNHIDVISDFPDFIPCFGNVDVLSKQGDFRLINKKTNQSVTVSLDREISSFVVWMWQKAFSAEQRLMIDIAPGKSFKWEYVYSFEN